MVVAWHVGRRCLPSYASKFSRHDFTLPQLFACLVLRQFYNLSYRKTQALLADSPNWRRAIGLRRTPDHNTLCDAFDVITKHEHLDRMLDLLVQAFAEAGLLQLAQRPLSIDSSLFESRHVSRHFERRRRSGMTKDAVDAERSRTVKRLPKLAIAVATACHVICGMWTTTGGGSDHRNFEPVLFDAWRRAPVKVVVADAGYDREWAHMLARDDMSLISIIPPRGGRPTTRPPRQHYRRVMYDAFADGSVATQYGQRWQVETVNSMLKRNHGSALRARTASRRERELQLKAITHNIAL
jgi:IS5 family transposase